MMPREEIQLDESQQKVYDSARQILNEPPVALGPLFLIEQPLVKCLGHLKTLAKQEAEFVLQSERTRPLTTLLTQRDYQSNTEALQDLHKLAETVPRSVCQHPFKKNDIVWVCRTCQADETCVLCHECFSSSTHEGHDIHFYHAQAGGCCDCGDPDAWDPAGFCPRHGAAQNAKSLPVHLEQNSKGLVPAVVDWIVGTIDTAEEGFARVVTQFSPDAASKSSAPPTPLGALGRLYIVLYADEIHSPAHIVNALRLLWGYAFPETQLYQVVDALRTHGQLIVYGPAQVSVALGATQADLWKQGDKAATERAGTFVQDKAHLLRKHQLTVSILTHEELLSEQTAVSVLQWLAAVARSCDPLCRTVAESILPNRHLVPLLQADFKMSCRVTKAWYALLLTLLAVPVFKAHLAAAYCDTYCDVTAKYARGMGVLERSGYTLSVQFLNRVTYVISLVKERDLLGRLGMSLLDTLMVAANGRRLDPEHFALSYRRYSPAVSDLKCVLNVPGMARVAVSGSFLDDWMKGLSFAQMMDPQVWRHRSLGHVEEESRGWVGAFNGSISLGSLFERLLGWKDGDECPVPFSPLLSGVEVAFRVIINGLIPWQTAEATNFKATSALALPHERASASLPFSTVAVRSGTATAMKQLPTSQITPFSFHIPLHRFFATAVRELCLRPETSDSGIAKLMIRLQAVPGADEFFGGLMEYPSLVLSRVAQIRSDLWKRNGPSLNDQVLNYAEPPFCRNMRDADLLLTQFAVLGRRSGLCSANRPDSDVGMAYLMNLLLHRFGLFDFCGFVAAPQHNSVAYLQEVKQGLFEAELQRPDEVGVPFPWTHSPTTDTSSMMKLLEELLHFLIIFISELPTISPLSTDDQVRQAKYRLRREVIHRLSSGAKTHSELSEVHHVLSSWDNLLLNEEGKQINPDDASGAALGVALDDVAERKSSTSSKPEPDRWHLKKEAWNDFDPAFYHISMRNHQGASEMRPSPKIDPSLSFGAESHPYVSPPQLAHPFFRRLRRDATADISLISLAYVVLRNHCSDKSHSACASEATLARTVHLLTLGAYAWSDAGIDNNWREHGGGSCGSVFQHCAEAPTAQTWVDQCLLRHPRDLVETPLEEEEHILDLLVKLASHGGGKSGFIAQDANVRAGAAWLCTYAKKHSTNAARLLHRADKSVADQSKADAKKESEIEKRKRMAQERALARMQAQAAKFASTVMELDSANDESMKEDLPIPRPGRPQRSASFTSTQSSASSGVSVSESSAADHIPAASFCSLASEVSSIELSTIQPRLLAKRPCCIICNDMDGGVGRFEQEASDISSDNHRKKSRRRMENALGLVGYSQASTVLRGGGGAPVIDLSKYRATNQHVGTHTMLCGHAVHYECCESYLSTVFHREDRSKRDEFKCPLCQRLSNCLVPFVDVGTDWIETPSEMSIESEDLTIKQSDWWVAQWNHRVKWDGHSSFVTTEGEDESPGLPSKRDVYAAWNAMMKTPKIARQRLCANDASSSTTSSDATGETLVWRRFMDQVSDIGYKSDSKRLGDERFQSNLGEFRHYFVEKYTYNVVIPHMEQKDWPHCLYADPITDARKDELAREKLLSKLFASFQSFTYSVCCEEFDVGRLLDRSPSEKAAICSQYGISHRDQETRLIFLPKPTNNPDGSQPFQGRLGKLRYLGLALMSAAGGLPHEVVQLSIPFPSRHVSSQSDEPDRSPITSPLLLGHVLTHTVAAMCAACGRARAEADSIKVKSPLRDENLKGQRSTRLIDHLMNDCVLFMRLGFLGRCVQVLLCDLGVPASALNNQSELIATVHRHALSHQASPFESQWLHFCASALETTLSPSTSVENVTVDECPIPDYDSFVSACYHASAECCSFLQNTWLILQVLVPGACHRFFSESDGKESVKPKTKNSIDSLSLLWNFFNMHGLEGFLSSDSLCSVLSGWFDDVCRHTIHGEANEAGDRLQGFDHLRRTMGFRGFDWPSASIDRAPDVMADTKPKPDESRSPILLQDNPLSDYYRKMPSRYIKLDAKNSLPLIGGWVDEDLSHIKKRVPAMLTSYTDLYAELGSLMPDCEQTAVCLICGEVLSAEGKGQCTRHSYVCGAGTGIFFLLQSCTSLIMHKGKAAYAHCPYVDSHGETPQFRGRPLNLDRERYEHLREMWIGHSIRNQVLVERSSSRPIITPNYY